MKYGSKPNKYDRQDYGFHQTYGNTAAPVFLAEYLTDAGLGFPNQNTEGLPFGCTDETQASLKNDLMAYALVHPTELENLTHANALGGFAIRDSLKAAQSLGWFSYYFNVTPHGKLDWFDAIRLAISSGIPEKRSVSIGTPWFTDWLGPIEVLPLPNLRMYGGWHNWKICGWKEVEGEPMLILMSWQGNPPGFQYISRSTLNAVMKLSGTCAFTTTDNIPHTGVKTIPFSVWQWVISNFLLGLAY